MNIALSNTEQERTAYITGNHLLATYAGDCGEQEDLIDSFEDQLDNARSEGYKEGHLEGIGTDVDTILAAQRQEIARLKTEFQSLRTYLTDLKLCLEGDACKTIAGRKQAVQSIRAKLLAAPRY